MLEQESILSKESSAGEWPHRWLIALVNFCLSFAAMASFIFIPLLGAQLGASNFDVGLVGAAYGIAFLFSSLFSGWKSDHLGRLLFVRWGLLISSAAFAVQLLAHSVLVLIIVRGVVGFSLGIATAATITYAFESGANMGKYSSYGSLGWIFGAVASALVGEIQPLFWLSFLVCLLSFFLSLAFQRVPTHTFSKPPNLWHVMRRDYRVYLAVFLRHLGAAAVWVIFPLYLASIGLDNFWIGLLWGVNFAVQFVVMRQLERFSEFKTFFYGQLLSILVFTAYAFVTGRFYLIIIQVVMGVAWSCLYVGALLIVLRSGKEKGTAGGIFQSTLNLCNAVGPMLGGLIAQEWGYRGVMFFAVVLCMCGLLVAVPENRKVPGNQT
jgi:MFS family permease